MKPGRGRCRTRRDARAAARQQPQDFDPHADGGEMRRQDQLPGARAGVLMHRQQRHHHRQQPHAAQADRERGLDQGRAGAERRDQNDLRRGGPDQHRRQHRPADAKAEIMGERAEADIGAEQRQTKTEVEADRKPSRKAAPVEAGIGSGSDIAADRVSQRQASATAHARMQAMPKRKAGRIARPYLDAVVALTP